MITDKSTNRINGLDTLRSAAIMLVFMYHYMVFASGSPTFGSLSRIGWVGVDLFFVLSGYLIGNQILSTIAQRRPLSLRTFYIRRFFRTLPNFYVVLALYALFPLALGGSGLPPLWKFLTFTQNLDLIPGTSFSHAWSLCIEEQFYLLLPAVAVLVAASGRSRRVGWTLIAAVILGGMAARGILWLDYGRDADGGPNGYYTHIYYSSLGRFDELVPGVALAMLKNFHGELWARLMQRGKLTLAIGLLAVALMFYLFLNFHYYDGYGYGFFMTAFGYPLLAISFAILTLSALSPGSPLHKIRVPGAERLALWSYAIYLTHKPLFAALKAPMSKLGISAAGAPGVIMIVCASILGGWLLYRVVEQPLMALRERLYKTDLRHARTEVSVVASKSQA